MINLAGVAECDRYIERELRRAGIAAVVGERSENEVAAAITGKIGPFTLWRAWRYWVVKGPMPLAVAREMYDDPVGVDDVRVAGHCGCPPPDEWARDGVIDTYHIDTEVGLRVFVDAVKRHGLDKER
jgi:hypothetical protein